MSADCCCSSVGGNSLFEGGFYTLGGSCTFAGYYCWSECAYFAFACDRCVLASGYCTSVAQAARCLLVRDCVLITSDFHQGGTTPNY